MENHVYHPVKHLFPWDPIRNRVKFPILNFLALIMRRRNPSRVTVPLKHPMKINQCYLFAPTPGSGPEFRGSCFRRVR